MDLCKLIYTNCQVLMKFMISHCNSSILFTVKVNVALCETHSDGTHYLSVTFKVLFWCFLCNFLDVVSSIISDIIYLQVLTQ